MRSWYIESIHNQKLGSVSEVISRSQTYPSWKKKPYTQLIFLHWVSWVHGRIKCELWVLGGWVWNLNSQPGTPIYHCKHQLGLPVFFSTEICLRITININIELSHTLSLCQGLVSVVVPSWETKLNFTNTKLTILTCWYSDRHNL